MSVRKLRNNCGSGLPLVLVGILAIAHGTVFDSPLMIPFGAAIVVVPLVSLWAVRKSLSGLRLERFAPTSAFEGDTIELRLTLENRSRLPVFQPRVLESFTPELGSSRELVFPMRVRPGETVERTYRGACLLPRGYYALGPAVISVSDPFGWFERRKTVLSGDQKLKVYPHFDLFGVHDKQGHVLSLIEDYVAQTKIGSSNEFFSVREYRQGDPFRRLHWPLTAHLGYPVVREFARNAVGDLYLVVDLYRYALIGIGRGSSMEHSIKITAALAAKALELGHRVSMFAHGKSDVSLPIGTGSAQLHRLLDLLVPLKPDGSTRLDALLEVRAGEISTGATLVIMVSPYLRSSDSFNEQVQALGRRGVRIILVVFDDTSFRSVYDRDPDADDIDSFIQRHGAQGIDIYVVPCAAHLPSVFASPVRAST